jgi:hypothetical protein
MDEPMKFGDWTVIADYKVMTNCRGKKQARYICECSCGVVKLITLSDLRTGKRLMCKKCTLIKNPLNVTWTTTHGQCRVGKRSSEYSAWLSMRSRCRDINNRLYGGRGIRVCERWDKFDNFFEDMGKKPDGYQIDRINPDGNYELSNCRWVSQKENMENRRNSIKYRGEYFFIKKSALCPNCSHQ